LGGRGRRISEFEASLVYRVSSRTARATQRNPVSGKKKKKKKRIYFLYVERLIKIAYIERLLETLQTFSVFLTLYAKLYFLQILYVATNMAREEKKNNK
jgi:hypothetical protein